MKSEETLKLIAINISKWQKTVQKIHGTKIPKQLKAQYLNYQEIKKQAVAALSPKKLQREQGNINDPDIPMSKLKWDYKIPLTKKGSPIGGSINITFSPKDGAAFSNETLALDKDGDGTTDYKESYDILTSKVNASGKSLGKNLAVCVGNMTYGETPPELKGWVNFSFSLKGPEGKLDFEKGEVEVSALRAVGSATVDITPKKYLLSIGIDKNLVELYTVTIAFKISFNIAADDLARLGQMIENQAKAIEQVKELAKKENVINDLNDRNKKLQKLVDDGWGGRNKRDLRKHFGIKNKKQFAKFKEEIAQEIAENTKVITQLEKAASKHKSNIQKAANLIQKYGSKLKNGTAKYAGKLLQKLGGQALKKVLVKFIPIVGALSTAADIAQLCIAIINIDWSKAGQGSGGMGNSTEDGPQGRGDGTEEEEKLTSEELDNLINNSANEEFADLLEPVEDPFEVGDLDRGVVEFLQSLNGDGVDLGSFSPEQISMLNSFLSSASSEELETYRTFLNQEGNNLINSPEEMIGQLMNMNANSQEQGENTGSSNSDENSNAPITINLENDEDEETTEVNLDRKQELGSNNIEIGGRTTDDIPTDQFTNLISWKNFPPNINYQVGTRFKVRTVIIVNIGLQNVLIDTKGTELFEWEVTAISEDEVSCVIPFNQTVITDEGVPLGYRKGMTWDIKRSDIK
ncbi:MAG: hypothetical protein GY810_15640 [Aureispira sp.]|nr:hypothetical protein [Aureispira sp.]